MHLQALLVFIYISFNTSFSSIVRQHQQALSRRTNAADIEALQRFKVAIADIPPTSCLSSWDFSRDPCESISTSFFTCGIRCNSHSNPMRVTEITLDSAGYTASISPFIGNLSALQVLDLSGNAFHGHIPVSITNLRSLLKLELSQNSLSGEIPESIGHLEKLNYLCLSNNKLVGKLPSSVDNLHSLQRLSVFNNLLTGSIPNMSSMVSLLYFDGSSNMFSGSIPVGLPSSILELSLRMNHLQGRLPLSLASLEQIEVLDLSHNSLTGHVEPSLFRLPSLQQLNLAYNRFGALLPVNHVKDSQLVEIDLSYNQLRGRLPVFFVEMTRLTALSLGHNQFIGLIPIEYALKSVRMLIGAEPLMRLYLESNFLVGELPSPFLAIPEGQVAGSLVGNCLQSCPVQLFLCQGGDQRPLSECTKFPSVNLLLPDTSVLFINCNLHVPINLVL